MTNEDIHVLFSLSLETMLTPTHFSKLIRTDFNPIHVNLWDMIHVLNGHSADTDV